MNTPRLFFYVFIAIIFIGCNRSRSEKNEQTFDEFPNEETLIPEKFADFSKGKITHLLIFDTLLFARNSKKTVKEYFVYSYSLNTKGILDSTFKLGSAKNEILSPLSTGLNSKSLWVYDFGKKKVNIAMLATPKIIEEFQVKTGLYSIQVNDSSQLYGNGDYEKEWKIQKIDIASGKILKSFGQYGKAPDGIHPMSWRSANESFLFLRPDNKMLVSAFRFTDKIEIFDLTTFKSKIISGPENFEIAFKPLLFYKRHISERTKDTRFGFVGGYTTNKYIYLLYSGNNHASENLDFGKSIFVYDWDGNPVRKIKLPNYISCFAVKEDKELFVFDVAELQIKKVNLN